jgi:toxin CptA
MNTAMSSSSFGATVDLTLQPSVRGLQALFFLHGIPVAALPFAMAPGVPMVLLLAGFAASWIWLRRHRALGFGPRALTRLVWHATGGWTVYNAAGTHADAELLPNSFRHAAILVLNFRLPDGSKRTRILLGDEAPVEALRRLRARLATQETPTDPA